MKAVITFEIECGEVTCASASGVLCEHYTSMGTVPGKGMCYLFGRVFADESGWIKRHEECMKRAKEMT